MPTMSLTNGNFTTGPDGALWYTRSFDGSVGRITVDGVITNHAYPSLGESPNGMML